jgi:hypothetical protein
MEFQYEDDKSQGMLWGSGGEWPNLRSLTLRSFDGRENWPDHLFQQLNHLEIVMPLQKGNNPSFHRYVLRGCGASIAYIPPSASSLHYDKLTSFASSATW